MQLPSSSGYDTMVIVDHLSKWFQLALTNGEVTSKDVAWIFSDVVWRDFGFPEVVISNQGSQFISKFTKDLYWLLGRQTNPSQPITHRQMVDQPRSGAILTVFVNHWQDDWTKWLPLAKFSYNNKIQTSMGYSPFYLNYRQHLWKPIEPRQEIKTEAADVFVRRMQKIREEAVAN